MNKVSTNTFIRGLNKDLDKSVVSKDSYLDANNFRLVTSKGASSSALENIKGNKRIASAGLLPSGQLICSSVRLRDYIVLFSTSNTSTPVYGTGRNMIHKLKLDKNTEDVDALTVLYDDSLNVSAGDDTLDFSTANVIKAVAKYETPNIQKVYWVDGYNNLRYANVAAPLTVTGEAYSSPGDYMTTDKFEFLPAFTPSRPQLEAIVGGNLLGGVVQYSYQLYRLNGAETAFSPVSDMIHIVMDNDFLGHTLLYKGDVESKFTGKGCRLTIDVKDDGYNRLRLVRIHYSSLNSIPVIAVAGEIEISTTAGPVMITDVGDTVSSLTLDEFSISSTELFKAADIAIKDNRLFAAGIEKSEFTMDEFDVRAVRFKSASTARVYSDSGSYIDILADLSNWGSYEDNHDGINYFNDPTKTGDSLYQWMYQADGTTIGAEGKYIKIDFETDPITLDIANDQRFYCSSGAGNDGSFKNYASPWKGGLLSWQRDEVYRLFVVWGNDRGQVTDPRWMIDLRMPSLHDADFTNSTPDMTVSPSTLATQTGAYGISTRRLYPRVYFKDWPVDATWCQIYRVKREREDRSVVTQGLAIPSRLDAGVYYPNTIYHETSFNVLPNNGKLFKFVSPEINITKNISHKSSDYIEYVTNFSTGAANSVVRFSNTAAYDFGHVDKMKYNTRVAFTTACVTSINEAYVIPPATTEDSEVVQIDSKSYSNYCTTTNIDAKGCTGLLIAYKDATWSAEEVTNVIVNYRSNVYGSQYGGYTYEARALNVSIPCSDVIYASDISTWIDVPFGDTFINYFDVSTLLADLTKEKYYQTWSETVYIPLESSINCDLRHDIESAHHYTTPASFDGYIPFLRQEYPGDHVINIHGEDRTFNQTKPLYLYNTVYSQQPSAQYAMSEMIDTPNETDFDCLVRASNLKYAGELTDSWTKFNLNEEIEVDSNYGEIRALLTFNNNLYFWQEDALGVLSVNSRSLIQDGNTAQLVLGTGGILDRFDYISTTIGLLDKRSIINSDTAIYWFYDKDYSIYRFSSSLSNLTKEKMLWSWFRTTYTDDYVVHGIYDREYNEVIYTLYKSSDATGYTLAFNEQVDQFTSFYSFVPRLYIDYKDVYLTVRDYLTNTYSYVFWHNSDINPRCEFYDTVYASTIKLLCNDGYPLTKSFDNIFFISNAFDATTEIEQYDITFDEMRCYNDYQNTDWVDLVYPTNIMRRERGWTVAVPRNMVDENYTTSPDIFTDLAATKTWAERIRDKYMVLDLSFDNVDETRFVVPFIGIKYRISYR